MLQFPTNVSFIGLTEKLPVLELIENNEVSVRNRAGENSSMQLSKFISGIASKIDNKSDN